MWLVCRGLSDLEDQGRGQEGRGVTSLLWFEWLRGVGAWPGGVARKLQRAWVGTGHVWGLQDCQLVVRQEESWTGNGVWVAGRKWCVGGWENQGPDPKGSAGRE